MRRLIRVAAITGVLALTGGAAIAATTGTNAADPLTHSAKPIAAADPEQLAAFGVLRRERSDRDVLPEAAAALIAQGPGPDLGANPALSRLTVSDDGVQLYVVPGAGWLCLVDDAGRGSCNRTEEARKGYLLALTQVREGSLLRGVLPDGTTSVKVSGPGGGQEAKLDSNGWAAAVTFEPRTVTFSDAAGSHDIAVYTPQK